MLAGPCEPAGGSGPGEGAGVSTETPITQEREGDADRPFLSLEMTSLLPAQSPERWKFVTCTGKSVYRPFT